MSNSEVFLYPGEWAFNLLLSIFGSYPAEVDPGFYLLLSGLFALLIWSWLFRLCFEIVKKAFGFGRGSRA